MFYDYETLEMAKVLKLLASYAKTNYAKEKIFTLEPKDTIEDVKILNQETAEALLAINRLSDVPLGGLYEVKDALKRVQIGSILNATELLDIVGLIDCGNNVIKYFLKLEGLKLDLKALKEYVNKIIDVPLIKNNILLAISADGKVNDNASRELFTIRKNITSTNNRLRSKLNELVISKANMLSDNIIVIRNNRMCLPVKIEYKNSFKGILHDISSSNTTCYIEPEATAELANQIDSLLVKEAKEIEIILKNLSLLVSAHSEELITNLEALTNLDVIYAKALMAKENDYNSPIITDKQYFHLKKAKHPLLPAKQAVPIDVELGKDYQIIVITGPNTGGKTVAIKTVGLLHLMALCGMFIPAAADSVVSFFSEILVDIDDTQSIEQSLSTFSAHMIKMNEILNKASFQSLILLDELGSGTDPKEGSSLAIAMIEYLKKKGALLIVTTHYSDLKNYAYNTDGVINASVEFSSETLMPTYRLLVGVPGRSNAIEIAKRLGLPDEIILDSRKNLDFVSNPETNKMMANLEDEITNLRAQEVELEHKIVMYDSLNQKLSAERLKLTKEKDKIVSKAVIEANRIILEAKEEANALIAELKNMTSTSYKEHELADLKHRLKELKADDNSEDIVDDNLEVGDYVYIKSYEQNGTITKIKKDVYTVQFGQFTMNFNKTDLIKAIRPKEKVKPTPKMSGYSPAPHVGLSLDLRGKRYEEVKDLMDSYLDQALLGNLDTVSIIHGFGTGAIRKAVWEYLKDCPFVKSYRFGQEGEGLNGVTIVKLK